MKSDTLGLILTYGLAYVVVIGGGYIVAVHGSALDELLKGAIIGFIGSALTFVFGAEVQKRTARQQERALLTSPANGITYTAASPADPAPEGPTS